MAKSQSITISPSVQQQGSKNIQTGRPQNMPTASLTKGATTYDEFKYGFPSDGLSSVSNKWWVSNSLDGYEGVHGKGAEPDIDKKHRQAEKLADETASSITADKEKCESGKEKNNTCPQGTDLLVAVRKRAVEEGEKALKLGVFRGYGAKKLGRRERTLLLQLFKSATPKQWIHESC